MREKRIAIELPPHRTITKHGTKYWHDESYDWFVEMLPADPEAGYDEPGIAASSPDWDDENPGTAAQAREFALALLAAVSAADAEVSR